MLRGGGLFVCFKEEILSKTRGLVRVFALDATAKNF